MRRVGVVACNESDHTQHWLFDAKTGQVNNDAKHDLNSGPVCKGDSGNSMLLYPTQAVFRLQGGDAHTRGALLLLGKSMHPR